MNKKRIEEMIPIAMEILNSEKEEIKDIIQKKDGEKVLISKYDGYIASYGPTIRQSGLMQAVNFHENHKTGDRKKINDLIVNILKDSGFIGGDESSNLSKLVMNYDSDPAKKSKITILILEAITACKLAMRTFKKEKPEGGSHD
ncbi:MAG: hypothetical protein COW04_13450 [Deltaproteobacteria bacterium CG12_big_fil_rev_8_21_14_0_65_43_10]|nr:MAG: hypothetical protein AUK23_06045 [Deltaproteobacteria bacterium CG2_30_43_15]PIQ44345.1 MAG: hypothetical protein COW04_13450 [Deltaproteobacteria bacterium CG12_big_fil_rev_8_21_14_0_65_43_10]PIU84924.1 MAG: hypothetical protein COS67_10665 [Deltaproteobacteria bacterium CG06_land_8_20_14_3_00_44_19]PIX23227.1 MAG: hypothetical protein COZ68_10030 [Deltaproteobacteria bacterium CG_4_8_14_3_um_filter_43_13]PIZ19825.1 MAG: hypothetical protein COY50_08020 [Deltaproteobacteria bacterium C